MLLMNTAVNARAPVASIIQQTACRTNRVCNWGTCIKHVQDILVLDIHVIPVGVWVGFLHLRFVSILCQSL